jgi:membrane protein required for colicin V production
MMRFQSAIRNPQSTIFVMQTYDLLMLLVLVAATLFGFWKGMAWQLASLASIVVSYLAALKFSDQLAPVVGDHAPWNKMVAMLAIYIGTSFVVWMLFRLVSGAIDKVRLESFDRQLGAMFGFAKGVLLCVAITFFAVSLMPQAQGEAIVASQSGRYIVALLDKSHSVFPPEIHQIVDPYLNRVEERLNPNFRPHSQDGGGLWPAQAQLPMPVPTAPVGWPQVGWPQPPAQTSPQQSAPPPATQSQPAWPAQSVDLPANPPRNPYSTPREPNPFPYQAEAPGGRDF